MIFGAIILFVASIVLLLYRLLMRLLLQRLDVFSFSLSIVLCILALFQYHLQLFAV